MIEGYKRIHMTGFAITFIFLLIFRFLIDWKKMQKNEWAEIAFIAFFWEYYLIKTIWELFQNLILGLRAKTRK
jgi:hypothetical protein